MSKKKPHLEPCPFCGSDNVNVYGWSVMVEYNIQCDNCGCSTKDWESVKEAVVAWNKRTNNKQGE